MNNQNIASFLDDIKKLKTKADLQSDTNERFALASQKLGELLVATENMEDTIVRDTSDKSDNQLLSGSTEAKSGKVTSLKQTAEKGLAGYTKPAPLAKWWREDQAKSLTTSPKIMVKDNTKTTTVLSRPKDRVEISKIPPNSKKKITETQPKKQPQKQKKTGFLSALRNRNKVLKAAAIASPETQAKTTIAEIVPEKAGETLSVADQAAQHVTQSMGQFEDRSYENETTQPEGSRTVAAPQKGLLVSTSPGINNEAQSATAKAAIATILGVTAVSTATSNTMTPVQQENHTEPAIAEVSTPPVIQEAAQIQDAAGTETTSFPEETTAHDIGNLVEDEIPLAPVDTAATKGNDGFSQEVQLAAAATAATAAALALSKRDVIVPEEMTLATPERQESDIIELADPQPGQHSVITENQETGFDHLPEPELEYAQPAPEEIIASSQIESSPLEIAATALEKPPVKVDTSEITNISVPLASGEPVIGHGIAPDQSAVSKNISTISDDFSLQNAVQPEPALVQETEMIENTVEIQPTAELSAITEPEITENTVIEVEVEEATPDIQVNAPFATLPIQGLPPVVPETVTSQPAVAAAPIATTPIAAIPVVAAPIAAAPVQNQAPEQNLETVSQEHIVLTGQDIQYHPEYGTKKKGFFSRLFGKK